jgi:hypothetical protein
VRCCGWRAFPIRLMPVAAAVAGSVSAAPAGTPARDLVTGLTPAEMRQMLARAGALHNIDADLLASVVAAESGGKCAGGFAGGGARD